MHTARVDGIVRAGGRRRELPQISTRISAFLEARDPCAATDAVSPSVWRAHKAAHAALEAASLAPAKLTLLRSRRRLKVFSVRETSASRATSPAGTRMEK